MTASSTITKPFDIYEVDFLIAGDTMEHLAGADMAGINRIIPMPDGTEMPLLDARGTPIGRASPRPNADRMAMVMISVYSASDIAAILMGYVASGEEVSATIKATADAGTAFSSFKVGHVVFSCPPYDFDSGSQAVVFQGIGWGITVDAADTDTGTTPETST